MKEPLVFLPGFMCDVRQFWPQLMEFGASRATMVAPLTGASAIGAMSAEVLGAAPRRFALIGQGIGGIVAMEILRRAPDRVIRIALLDTCPLPETPNEAAAREPAIVAAQAGRLSEIIRDQIGPQSLAQGPLRGEILILLTEMAESLGPEVFVAQSRAMQRRPDLQKTLRTTKVPALVLCGEHEQVFPIKRHEFMAELIPNATLTVVPGAGHLPALEQPEATNAALWNWLKAPLVLS